MDKTNMSAPWYGYYNKIVELFGEDPDISLISMNAKGDMADLQIYVDEAEKAEAISHLLPETKTFGKVVMNIKVIPANKEFHNIDDIERAFKGNPNFVKVEKVPIEITQTNPINYVIFKNKVVQYYDDNIGDPHGNVSTLLECIARDVIEGFEGTYFCTASLSEEN